MFTRRAASNLNRDVQSFRSRHNLYTQEKDDTSVMFYVTLLLALSLYWTLLDRKL